jgi:hypothetical protein
MAVPHYQSHCGHSFLSLHASRVRGGDRSGARCGLRRRRGGTRGRTRREPEDGVSALDVVRDQRHRERERGGQEDDGEVVPAHIADIRVDRGEERRRACSMRRGVVSVLCAILCGVTCLQVGAWCP